MLRCLLTWSLLAGVVVRSPQPTNPLQAGGPTITIRMLNGKTEKPVAGDLSNVWLGDAKQPQILKTDEKGEITVSIGDVQPASLRFLPNYYVDCRYKKDTPSGRNIQYQLGKIISEGIVAENLCGKRHTYPAPGVLVIYVRKRTFLEGMRQ